MTQTDGSITTDRASLYGTYSSNITELALWFDNFAPTPYDALMAFFFSDDVGNLDTRNALISGAIDFTHMAVISQTDSTTGTTVIDILLTDAFTDASTVDACDTEAFFGGGECQPGTMEIELFQAQN